MTGPFVISIKIRILYFLYSNKIMKLKQIIEAGWMKLHPRSISTVYDFLSSSVSSFYIRQIWYIRLYCFWLCWVTLRHECLVWMEALLEPVNAFFFCLCNMLLNGHTTVNSEVLLQSLQQLTYTAYSCWWGKKGKKSNGKVMAPYHQSRKAVLQTKTRFFFCTVHVFFFF